MSPDAAGYTLYGPILPGRPDIFHIYRPFCHICPLKHSLDFVFSSKLYFITQHKTLHVNNIKHISHAGMKNVYFFKSPQFPNGKNCKSPSSIHCSPSPVILISLLIEMRSDFCIFDASRLVIFDIHRITSYLLQLFQSSMTREISLQIYALTVHAMTRPVSEHCVR